MIDKESDIRPVGYGAMLIEGVVGIMALIAAASMAPGDYFAINVPPAVYANLTFEGVQMVPVNVPAIEAAVGETVVGRTGGAVSLAVGMAQIFAALPGMQGLLAYWYHFAIMFEALFILTTIDSGTRVGRFLIQEFMGRVHAPFARADNFVRRLDRDADHGVLVGVFHLHGSDRDDLAVVRGRQPAARVGGAGGVYQHPDQPGPHQVHLGDDWCRCCSSAPTRSTAAT